MKFLHSNLLLFTAQKKKASIIHTLFVVKQQIKLFLVFCFQSHHHISCKPILYIFTKRISIESHSPLSVTDNDGYGNGRVVTMKKNISITLFLFIFQMIQKSSPCWSPALARTGTRNQFTVMQVSVPQFRSRSRICGTMSRPTRLTTRRASNGSTGQVSWNTFNSIQTLTLSKKE